MISKPTIARIQEACRIEEVVGDFLTLKKRGVNFLARCPFHNEKTPSFNVNPVRNIYKCFGCGKGGDSVNFIMEHEKLTYPEALRWLARKYNIEIEEIYNENAEEEKKKESERESLYVVSAFAQKYFTAQLHESEEGRSIGLSYFKERGLENATIEKFQLGYAPEGKTVFTDAALKEGYTIEYLVRSGLTISIDDQGERKQPNDEQANIRTDEQSNKYAGRRYDRFAGRVMFPIHNITGRVIGFGGRALKKEVKAKYLNSPESDIYHKSNVLYGLSLARKSMAVEDNCYLVEGYMDVISMHQSGIENVVASSGTALTVEQVRLIKRYTQNITIMYDGDPAGIKASFRGIDLILEEGMNVRVVLFPEGNDPDSYAKEHSTSELKEFINENKKDFIRFKTQLLYNESANDPIKKAALIQQIVESIALIPNAITRSVFVKECSLIMKMDEQALMSELHKALRKRYSNRFENRSHLDDLLRNEYTPPPQPIETKSDSSEYQEKELVRLALNYADREITVTTEEGETTHTVFQFIDGHLTVDAIEFESPVYQKIFELLRSGKHNVSTLTSYEDRDVVGTVIDLTTSPYSLSDWQKKHDIKVHQEEDILQAAVEHCIYSFKIRKIMKMITETMEQIKEAQDDEDLVNLLNRKKQLDEAKNLFSKELGWIVLK